MMLTRSTGTDFEFDLAIIDDQMAGMDGGELVAASLVGLSTLFLKQHYLLDVAAVGSQQLVQHLVVVRHNQFTKGGCCL